jgi:hypothetical protein
VWWCGVVLLVATVTSLFSLFMADKLPKRNDIWEKGNFCLEYGDDPLRSAAFGLVRFHHKNKSQNSQF